MANVADYSVKLVGTEALMTIYATVQTADFMQAVAQAVFAEANIIMNKSKDIVPLEFGILRASGTVMPPEINGTSWSITLGFGGAASAYALIQHENLSFHHPGQHSIARGQHGRTAKYLEEPVSDAIPGLGAKLTARVEAYFTPNTMGIA